MYLSFDVNRRIHVNSWLRVDQSRLAESLQCVEERDAQLASYTDHVSSLEKKLLDLSTSSAGNEQEIVRLRKLKEKVCWRGD